MIDILETADRQSEEREGKMDGSPIYNTQMSVILFIFVLPSLQINMQTMCSLCHFIKYYCSKPYQYTNVC